MRIGRIAAIDTSGGELGDLSTAVATYNELWMFLLYLGVGFGVFMLLISPLLRRWMHGIH
jgi:POT family proton-dependent oligopeptide transporter